MARIFITGSADGIGQLAAIALVAQGHKVVLHARNEKRAHEATAMVPGSEGVLVADLGNIEETKQLAAQLNASGKFDAVIHNAGIYNGPGREIFNVNVLSPYILTCLVRSERLIYLSSGMHLQGYAKLDSFKANIDHFTYADSKLLVLMLCKAVARKWPHIYANAVNPGWVPTKMGGKGAPDDLQKGYETQVWLAAGSDEKAKVSGRYFYHEKATHSNNAADDVQFQEQFLALCKEMTSFEFAV